MSLEVEAVGWVFPADGSVGSGSGESSIRDHWFKTRSQALNLESYERQM